MTLRILTVVGARPQFVKAGAFGRALAAHNSKDPDVPIRQILVHTGQHYDAEMSRVFFSGLSLADPDYNLEVGSGPHGWQTGEMLRRLEPVVQDENPDLILVYGDTNSTLAGALVASKLVIPVAHVEAGLRSWRRDMPEEVNRVLTDHVSTLLFAPSERAVSILESEGILSGVEMVGDVMHDVLLWKLGSSEEPKRVPGTLSIPRDGYAIATVHRPENADDPVKLDAILRGLGRVVAGGLPVVLPLHPRTRKSLKISIPAGIQVISPLPYAQMLHLVSSARVVLTDSGGLQKEAFWLSVPCVTLREETEWLETVEAGWNVLAGTDETRIVEAAFRGRPSSPPPPVYGHGDASARIIESLTEWHSAKSKPESEALATGK